MIAPMGGISRIFIGQGLKIETLLRENWKCPWNYHENAKYGWKIKTERIFK